MTWHFSKGQSAIKKCSILFPTKNNKFFIEFFFCSRYLTSTVVGRAEKPVSVHVGGEPLHDRLSIQTSATVVGGSDNKNNEKPSYNYEHEHENDSRNSNKTEMTDQEEHQQQILVSDGLEDRNRGSFFRSIAWAVSILKLPRIPSRRTRWFNGKRRRYFGPPTRSSLRLKGLPAENVGDLPKTKRRSHQRKRAAFQTEEESHFEEETAFDEQPESFVEHLLCNVLDFFGYFHEDEVNFDEDEEEIESEEVQTDKPNLLTQVFKRVIHLFRSVVLISLTILSLPFRLFTIPTLPPRKRSRRDKQFRAGSRSSLRLKGLPAESSGYDRSVKRRQKRQVIDDQTFSDNEDEEITEESFEEQFEREPFPQRCLDWILDYFGYFQYEEDDVVESEELDVERHDENRSSIFSRILSTILLPFKFFLHLLSFSFSFLTSSFAFPSRDFQWRKSKEGKYFRVGRRQSLRLRGLRAEDYGELMTHRKRQVGKRHLAAATIEERHLTNEEDVVASEDQNEEQLGRGSILFYSLLNRIGYFKQLEENDPEIVDNTQETKSLIRMVISTIFWPISSTFSLITLTFSFLKTSLALPSRSYQWHRTKDGKYFRVGSRQSLRLRGLPAEDFSVPEMSRSRTIAEAHEEQEQEVEGEEVGGLKVFFYSILNRFGYFEELNISTQESSDVQESGSFLNQIASWILACLGAVLFPIVFSLSSIKNAISNFASIFSLPSRDFQWKKNQEGKFFRAGSRQSQRLRGIAADQPADLPSTSSRRKRVNPRFDEPSTSGQFEDELEEVIGVFRSIFIRILNSFGYFDQLEVPELDDDVTLEESEHESFVTKIVSALLSPFVLLKSGFVKLTSKIFGQTSIDEETIQQDFADEEIRVSSRHLKPGRSSGTIIQKDASHRQIEESQTLVRKWKLYFFGSAKASGQIDSDSEDESNAALFENQNRQISKSSWQMTSKSLIAFPFIWTWNSVCSLANILTNPFRKTDFTETRTSSRLTGTSPRKSRRSAPKKTLQAEFDLSEDEEEGSNEIPISFGERFFQMFAGSDGTPNVVDSSNKSYVQIPSDSFLDDSTEHETTGNGNFVAKKFCQTERSSQRNKFFCCCLPLLLILIPLLLLSSICWIKPELVQESQVCKNINEYSSQIAENIYSGFIYFGETLTSISCPEFFYKFYENLVLVFASCIDQTVETSKALIGLIYIGFENGASYFLHFWRIVSQTFTDSFYIASDSVSTQVFIFADSMKNVYRVVFNSDSSESATSTETEAPNYFSTLLNTPLIAAYNLFLTFFSAILNLLTWTWSLIWSIFVNISFFFVSFIQWFRFSPSSSLDSQTKIGNDQLVKTILESSQFRDYVSQKSAEHFSEEQISFQQQLEEIYKRFSNKFQNEKEGFDSTVHAKEGELNLLRQSILHKLDSLSSEQTILSNRLQEQEKSNLKNVELNDLSSKFDLLKEEVLNYEKGLNDEDDERHLESRLSDLQSRIEKLESELSELKLEAKKCCRNDTYIRELVTSHLEKWLKEDFRSWNESALLLRDDLEATLIKVSDDLRRDILATTTEKMRQFAEGETEKTVELILTDVVSRLQSKNVTTKNIPENSSNFLVKEEIERMVKNALVVYDADKTGLFDFALETAGGSVVSTRCTETYVRTGASYTLLGIPIWWPSNNPRTAIQVR